MAAGLRAVGIGVDEDRAGGVFRVAGQGGALPRRRRLFIGNSGVSARFLTAAAALGAGRYRVDGTRPCAAADRPAARRPAPARRRGRGRGRDRLPAGGGRAGLPGGNARIPGGISSQYFSGLLLAAPYARADVTLEVIGELVSRPYLDVTAAVMADFGATLMNDDYRRFTVAAGQRYAGRAYDVEPDASAASYFFAAAAVTGGCVRVLHLGRRSAQGDLPSSRFSSGWAAPSSWPTTGRRCAARPNSEA